jgi:ABC-type multidrug transport system fused ATPase/permease subunit
VRFRILFDLRLRRLVTVRLLPMVYLLLLVLSGALCAGLVFLAFSVSWQLGLVAALISPVLFLTLVVLSRVGVELVLAVFELLAHADRLASVTEQMSDQLEGVAEDLPRLTFWRQPRRGAVRQD